MKASKGTVLLIALACPVVAVFMLFQMLSVDLHKTVSNTSYVSSEPETTYTFETTPIPTYSMPVTTETKPAIANDALNVTASKNCSKENIEGVAGSVGGMSCESKGDDDYVIHFGRPLEEVELARAMDSLKENAYIEKVDFVEKESDEW